MTPQGLAIKRFVNTPETRRVQRASIEECLCQVCHEPIGPGRPDRTCRACLDAFESETPEPLRPLFLTLLGALLCGAPQPTPSP